MAKMARPLATIWLLWITVYASLALAFNELVERDNGTASSTFILETSGSNLTFAISAADTDNVFFRFSAPSGNSWYGIGMGGSMNGALMFVMYQNSKGNGVVLSSRTSNGHTEPSYNSKVDCQTLSSSTDNDTLSITANCKNVGAVSGTIKPPLDLTSTKQPFIYAAGPPIDEISLKSDSTTVDLKRHYWYGHFTMDMAQASATNGKVAGVPTVEEAASMTGASLAGQATIDHYFGSGAHAVIMCFAFVILFPGGVLVLRLLERVAWHAGVQGVALLFTIVGVGTGISISKMYNKSRNVTSGHQILGLLVFALVLIQWGIGFYHHRLYKARQQPTIFGKIHRFAGPGILLLGVINGAVGFAYAQVGVRRLVEYIVIVVLVLIGVTWLLYMKRRRVARNRKEAGRMPGQGQSGFATPAPPYGAAPTQPYGQPPNTNAQYGGYYGASRGNSDVALERLDTRSSDQLPPYMRDDALGGPPTYPRPML